MRIGRIIGENSIRALIEATIPTMAIENNTNRSVYKNDKHATK